MSAHPEHFYNGPFAEIVIHQYPRESMAKNWTEEDEQFIRDSFLTMTYSDLADRFDVSTKAMESKIRRMGLKKQEFLAEAVQATDPTPAPPVSPVPAEEPVPMTPTRLSLRSVRFPFASPPV